MTTRIRFVSTLLAPSAGVFAGVLVGGMLTLGAEDCFAQSQHTDRRPPPGEVNFSLEKYKTEEETLKEERDSWARYLHAMVENFEQMMLLELSAAGMVTMLSDFLAAFSDDDPYSEVDDELREKVEGRLAYWKVRAGDDGTIQAESSKADPNACLDRLESVEQPDASGDFRLGRVRWSGEIMEPVLIRENLGDGAGYSFRDCSGGQPVETRLRDAEIFNSALVAYFDQEEVGPLESYREVQSVGYKPDGGARLSLPGTGSMLEARRLGDAHVEVTGTDSARISFLERIAVLLITTRETMRSMEPGLWWDESWGDRPEDSKIRREIVWWELTTSPGRLRIHPAVASFRDLASLAVGPGAGPEVGWESVLGENLKPLLEQDVLSLFVAEQPDHIGLAETMFKLASETKSNAELDVGMLEENWKKDAATGQRLEQAASKGRYLPFTHPFGLAAVMPERIAGKIRRNYRDRPSSSGTVETGLSKGYVTLATAPPTFFQLANAVYYDQTAGMAETMGFLECLLENDTAPSRFEILEAGLERMSMPAEHLEEMDVGKAFQHLFQGLSLPASLPVRERNFLRSVNSGDLDILQLVRSLQSYFDITSLEPGDACKIALIPDAALFGELVEPLVVPSTPLPAPVDPEAAEPVSPTESPYTKARRAKDRARIALKDAIYANGWRHTRREIKKGHERIESGDELLNRSNGEDGPGLEKAIEKYRAAEVAFHKAQEKAFKIEHSLPTLRVH